MRRSIRLGKGLRINLGRSGASLSVGTRGLQETIGPRGIRTTVGLPGTGLSYTATSKPKRGAAKPSILSTIIALFIILSLLRWAFG